MEPKAARSPASPFRRCSLAAPTCRVAQSLLAVKKNLEKLTFPLATTTTTTKQLKVFGGKKKVFPSKTGRAGREQVCTEPAPLCWEMKANSLPALHSPGEGGVVKARGPHEPESSLDLICNRSGVSSPNRGLDHLPSVLLASLGATSFRMPGCIEERHKSLYVRVSLGRSLTFTQTNEQTRRTASSHLIHLSVRGCQARRF